MIRRTIQPRTDWRARVEQTGLSWHQDAQGLCWNEHAVYLFTPDEIHRLRTTAKELHGLFMDAAAHVVRHGLWSRIGIEERDAPLIIASWEKGDPHLHGRFDFLLNENGQPKLVEYNAETALLLVETSVTQRAWLTEVMPEAQQWNTLHASLIAAWRGVASSHVHLAWRPRHREVEATVRYMAGIVRDAGKEATMMALHCLGWRDSDSAFIDSNGISVDCCYKLYPWEWMLVEPFARHLSRATTTFVEPLWSLMLSSKGMLSLLWDLFPDHPALVPCFDRPDALKGSFASKPLFGHEGQNVELVQNGAVLASRKGEYSGERHIYQQLIQSPRHDGKVAQLGVWIVQGEAVALGMREEDHPIIGGDSSFVPHAIPDGALGGPFAPAAS